MYFSRDDYGASHHAHQVVLKRWYTVNGYYPTLYIRNHSEFIVEVDIWQVAIAFVIAATGLFGAVTRYVRGAVKAQDAQRKIDVENQRVERTEEIANKQKRLQTELENEQKAMEVRIISEQSNSEQSSAMSAALATMAKAFEGLSKHIQQQNENNDRWRNTFIENHQATLDSIENSGRVAGQERQQQIDFLQQILTAVSANGGVGYGDKAIPHMLKLPPG